jgi:hypothetical protein
MLHDMVNDILATPGLSDTEKDRQIKRAIWMVSAQAHRGTKNPARTTAQTTTIVTSTACRAWA